MSLKVLGNNTSGISFTSRNNNGMFDDPRSVASSFVNMSDDQIRVLAYKTGLDKKHEKRSKGAIVTSLYAMPVVDSLARGILAKNSKGGLPTLSGRVGATGRTAAGWAGALVLVGAFNAVRNKLTKKSESYREFDKSNPLASLVLDLGVFTGVLLGASVGLSKLKNVVKAKKPNLFDNAKALKETLAAYIDKSVVNTKILPKIVATVEKLAVKAPWAPGVAKGLLRNSIWIVFGAGLLASASNARKNNAKIEKQYEALKEAQFETAKHLSNVLGVERDTLSQGSEIADELKSEMDKSL